MIGKPPWAFEQQLQWLRSGQEIGAQHKRVIAPRVMVDQRPASIGLAMTATGLSPRHLHEGLVEVEQGGHEHGWFPARSDPGGFPGRLKKIKPPEAIGGKRRVTYLLQEAAQVPLWMRRQRQFQFPREQALAAKLRDDLVNVLGPGCIRHDS